MQTKLLGTLITLIGLAACTNQTPDITPLTPQKPTVTLNSLAQQPQATNAFAALQQKFPAPNHRLNVPTGWAPSPWGLLDTTHILTLQQPQGRPYFTLNLQPAQNTAYNEQLRLLLYATPSGHKGLLLRYQPQGTWQPPAPFKGTLVIEDLQGTVVSTLQLGPNTALPATGKAAAQQRSTFEANSCLTNVAYYQECQEPGVSNTTGIDLPEELQHCVWVLELDYSICNEESVGAPGQSTFDGTPGTPLPDGGGSGSSGPTSPAPETPPTTEDPILTGNVLDLNTLMLEQWVEEQIYDSLLDDCIKDVLNDLREVKDGSIGTIMQMFSASLLPDYNWSIESGLLFSNAAATTKYNSNCACTVTIIDKEKLKDATDLFIANTVFHESVHAYLVTFQRSRPGDFHVSYEELIQDYYKTSSTNVAHHNEMVRRFHNAIAEALEKYGISQGYNLSFSYYKALAWTGLTETEAFKDLSPGNQSEILDVAAIERTGRDMNGNKQSPKGGAINCK